MNRTGFGGGVVTATGWRRRFVEVLMELLCVPARMENETWVFGYA